MRRKGIKKMRIYNAKKVKIQLDFHFTENSMRKCNKLFACKKGRNKCLSCVKVKFNALNLNDLPAGIGLQDKSFLLKFCIEEPDFSVELTGFTEKIWCVRLAKIYMGNSPSKHRPQFTHY
jgi:hypothetical protein